MIYFVSDAHFGSRLVQNPHEHEARFVRWLDSIKHDATTLYLLGDIFDFWFEYRTVVPCGFVRVLGKLAEMADAGVEIHFFTGNHDIWTFNYFEKEIGMIVHRKPYIVTHCGKTFYMRHGDALAGEKFLVKFIHVIFHNRFLQKCFQCVPPFLGQNLGYWWAKKSRESDGNEDFRGEDNEIIVNFAKRYAENHTVDYLIFGHRHILLQMQLAKNEEIIILGDFIKHFSYGKFDGEKFELSVFA